MPFDGLMLAAVRKELEEKILGGRIEKIYQPEAEELCLLISRPGSRCRLTISAHARDARIHLSEESKPNPTTPPLFCMVLRKHLEGGRIKCLSQPGLERTLTIHVEARDELGNRAPRALVCEFMGRHSNIILLEPETKTIIDGIKRYTHAVSRYREVLPGQAYLPPPPQGKKSPLTIDEEEFRKICLEEPLDAQVVSILQKRLEGFSTILCREIVYRAGLPLELLLDHCGEYEFSRLWQSLNSIIQQVRENRFSPTLVLDKHGTPLEFAAFELTHLEGSFKSPGIPSEVIEKYFSERGKIERFEKERREILSLLKKERAKIEKKLALQEDALRKAENADTYRLFGELLTANIYRLKRGECEAVLPNFYSEKGEQVHIPLDPSLTPTENAQLYFKRYSKAKSTREAAELQIKQGREELSYLDSVETALHQCTDQDELQQIKQELEEQGYLKSPLPVPKKTREREKLRPLSFTSSDGFTILIGKNNRQNEHLVTKMASDSDIWLHASQIPGSHVIIKTGGREVPPTTLEEAASLAAYYSKARHSQNVPVDYTLRKFVKKPRGSRPGYVTYENQKTIFINPRPAPHRAGQNH